MTHRRHGQELTQWRRTRSANSEKVDSRSGIRPIPSGLMGFERLSDPSTDPIELVAACARVALSGLAAAVDPRACAVHEDIRLALLPLEAEALTFDALFAFLIAGSWPLGFRFDVGSLRTPELASIRPPPGVAVVAALAPHPSAPRLGRAVALIHERPDHVYDPRGGTWRVPTPDDQVRWFRGSRHVLLVRRA